MSKLRLISNIKVKDDELLLGCWFSETENKGIYGFFKDGKELSKANVRFVLDKKDGVQYRKVVLKIPANQFIGYFNEGNNDYCMHLEGLKESITRYINDKDSSR